MNTGTLTDFTIVSLSLALTFARLLPVPLEDADGPLVSIHIFLFVQINSSHSSFTQSVVHSLIRSFNYSRVH